MLKNKNENTESKDITPEKTDDSNKWFKLY
jgi:hypothetical protein